MSDRYSEERGRILRLIRAMQERHQAELRPLMELYGKIPLAPVRVIGGMLVYPDESLSDDVAEFRAQDGEVVGRIIGLGDPE